MKKIISLVLVFLFFFSLAAIMPVLAEDDNNVNPELRSATSTEFSNERPKIEPRGNMEGDTSNLERIPAPAYIKYFEKIRKVGQDLFGVRKSESEVNKLKKEDGVKNADGTSASGTSSLERIPSPSQINLFEKIKKVGQDLFGVRKTEKSEDNNNASNNNNAFSSDARGSLEKIVSLDQVKFYDKITKIGDELFGLRKKGTYVLPSMSTELIACVSAAIDAKDLKLIEVLNTTATEISTAITARGTCQKAALLLTEKRQDALGSCNKTFQEAAKVAREKAKKAQNEIWKVYTTSLKACSTTASSSEIMIEDGSLDLGETLK